MSLIDYIQKLQEKTPREKHKIAFFTSLGISVFIFVIWISVVKVELRTDTSDTNTADLATPLKSLSASVSDAYKQFNEQVGNLADEATTSGLTQ